MFGGKAAAKLGVSQSALSYTMRTLEGRLGVRLLTRTTRSVSLTEAGERLFHSIGPRFDEIEAEITAVSEWRDKPAGTLFTQSHGHAIAYLRFDRTEGLTAGSARITPAQITQE